MFKRLFGEGCIARECQMWFGERHFGVAGRCNHQKNIMKIKSGTLAIMSFVILGLASFGVAIGSAAGGKNIPLSQMNQLTYKNSETGQTIIYNKTAGTMNFEDSQGGSRSLQAMKTPNEFSGFEINGTPIRVKYRPDRDEIDFFQIDATGERVNIFGFNNVNPSSGVAEAGAQKAVVGGAREVVSANKPEIAKPPTTLDKLNQAVADTEKTANDVDEYRWEMGNKFGNANSEYIKYDTWVQRVMNEDPNSAQAEFAMKMLKSYEVQRDAASKALDEAIDAANNAGRAASKARVALAEAESSTVSEANVSKSAEVMVAPESIASTLEVPAHPEAVAPAAHPEAVAPAAHPEAVAPAAHPEAVAPAAHPEAATPAAHPEPATPAAHPEPVTPAAHPEPVTPAAHPEPVTPAAHPEPVTPAAHLEPAPAAPSESTPAVAPAAPSEAVQTHLEPAPAAHLEPAPSEAVQTHLAPPAPSEAVQTHLAPPAPSEAVQTHLAPPAHPEAAAHASVPVEVVAGGEEGAAGVGAGAGLEAGAGLGARLGEAAATAGRAAAGPEVAVATGALMVGGGIASAEISANGTRRNCTWNVTGADSTGYVITLEP